MTSISRWWPEFPPGTTTHVERNEGCNEAQVSWQERQNYQKNSCSLHSRRKGGKLYFPLPITMMLDLHKDPQSPCLRASFRFVKVTRRKAVPTGSLTVQEVKRSEVQVLKWSQLHIDLQHLDEKLIAKPDDEGLIKFMAALKMPGSCRKTWETLLCCPKTIQ